MERTPEAPGLLVQPIAYIRSDFPAKFGAPRQSGLVPQLRSRIVFTPPFRDGAALRGIGEFSHLWLLWQFSESIGWSPTVRPPRLGGNERRGVFATRSPFRPNPIGLSSVELLAVEQGEEGPVLLVAGADLMDGTPILDIKPYLAYTDSHPDACGGFAAAHLGDDLTVEISPDLQARVPKDKLQALLGVLAQDPRPGYQQDPQRMYGLSFAGLNIKFRVTDGVLTVLAVE